MNKRPFLLAGLALLLLITAAGCASPTVDDEEGSVFENAVSEPETAISIAKAIVSEHFGKWDFENMLLAANLEDGTWIVSGSPRQQPDKNIIIIIMGGRFRVDIQKNDGKIVRIELHD